MAKKYSEEFIKQVLSDYKATNKKKLIADTYGVPLTTLNHWINNENVKRTNIKFSDEIKQKVINEYLEGSTIKELGNKYGIIEGTINYWVKPHTRKRGVPNKVGVEDFFDNIDTERKAYYLGWIMADGCVSIYNGQYSLKIHIQLKDRELIDNFVKDIQCTNSILEKNTLLKTTGNYHESCYISITSVYMIKALIRLGVMPNKTKFETIPKIPQELVPHFIRGFFDGDGIVSCKKYKAVGFVSNYHMLNQIEDCIPLGTSIVKHWKTEGIGTRMTGSKDKAKRLHDYMYTNSTICLKRKHDTLKAIIDGNTEVTCRNTNIQ